MDNKILREYGRRTGRTTKLADACIQSFFTKGYCICIDHHPTQLASELLFNTVWKRLGMEHLSSIREAIANKHKLIIAINKEAFQKAEQEIETSKPSKYR
jgi:hypothetical protein